MTLLSLKHTWASSKFILGQLMIPSAFKNAAFLNADGIITDTVTEAKEFYRDFTQDASYAQRLLDYTLLLPD